METFGRADGDGAGSSGTPQPPPLRKAPRRCLAQRARPRPAARGRCCRGAKAGGSGARQGRTNGAGKSAGQGDSSLAGEGGRAAERGTPLARRTKLPLCEPRPSPPRWETAQGGFLGQAGSRGRVPHQPPKPPGGWGPVCPARGGGSTLGPHPAKGQCHPAQGEGWPGCGAVPDPGWMLLPRHPAVWCPHGVSRGRVRLCAPRGSVALGTRQVFQRHWWGREMPGTAAPPARRGRMPWWGAGASTSGLLSRCPVCPCPPRPPRRPGRVIPGHTLAGVTARGGGEPLTLAQSRGHTAGPPCLRHPARWGN